jgi:lycopene beta-cyclase
MVDNTASLWPSLVCLLVVVVGCTFPWDSWAVKRNVWNFPDDRILFRIGVLPVEEVAFFIIQTLQVSLCTVSAMAMLALAKPDPVRFSAPVVAALVFFGIAWATLWIVAKPMVKRKAQYTYAWHLLFWLLPVISVQWIFGYNVLLHYLPAIVVATLFVGTYLSISDVWAIRHGIWFFTHTLTTGVRVAQVMPWEEVAFFYGTSLLVAQSIVLLA